MGEKIVEMPFGSAEPAKRSHTILIIILAIARPFVLIAVLVLIMIAAINPAQRIKEAEERQRQLGQRQQNLQEQNQQRPTADYNH